MVNIDDKTINKYGRFPFDRKILAQLIDKIGEKNPKVIALDIWFPESSTSDETLASSLFQAGNVVGSIFISEGKEQSKNLDELAYFPEIKGNFNSNIKSYVVNVEPIAGSLLARGHFHINNDFDGVLRHYHPFFVFNKHIIWGFVIEAYRIYNELDYKDIKLGKRFIQIGDCKIPTDEYYNYTIHFLKSVNSIPQISMLDLMNDKNKYDFKNKIVIVGVTATALHDYRATPISSDMPGVEIEATILNNLFTKNFIYPISFKNVLISLILMWFLGLLYIFVNKKFNYAKSILSLLIVIALFSLIHILLFPQLLLLYVVPMLFFIVLFTYLLSYYYMVSSKDARLLSHYLPHNVMRVLLNNPEMVKLGGEKAKIAVLFGDVAGFTTYSESHTPEEVVTHLNIILSLLTEKVFELNGTLDKYIGDCIMAFWGAPLSDNQACDHAVEASLRMLKAIDDFDKENNENFRLGIGINYGDAVVGNMGSKSVYDYTAMGDTVNTASRLEGVTRTVNNKLVISQSVYENLSDKYKEMFEKHDEKISVKGKKEKLTIYKLKNAPLK